jgi:hypothetical protein
MACVEQGRFPPALVDLTAARAAQLKPVPRALARHRRTVSPICGELASLGSHVRIMAQVIAIAEMLIPERKTKHALRDQDSHIMPERARTAMVPEPSGRAANQSDQPVPRPKQKPIRIKSDCAAVKVRSSIRRFYSRNAEPVAVMPCLHQGSRPHCPLAVLEGDNPRISRPEAARVFKRSGRAKARCGDVAEPLQTARQRRINHATF